MGNVSQTDSEVLASGDSITRSNKVALRQARLVLFITVLLTTHYRQ